MNALSKRVRSQTLCPGNKSCCCSLTCTKRASQINQFTTAFVQAQESAASQTVVRMVRLPRSLLVRETGVSCVEFVCPPTLFIPFLAGARRENMLSESSCPPAGKTQEREISSMRRNLQVRIRTLLSITLLFAALVAVVLGTTGSRSAHASANYVGSGDGSQQTVSVVVTFYGYNDNSGQTETAYGSADIAYPQNQGYPTLHNLATEGTGTYDDPVTFAVRTDDQATFPIGSITYFPLVHKYFIMEDQCGDTDPQGCLNGTHHTDLWFGPQSASNSTALANCENNSTPGSSVLAVINPDSTYPVDITPMFRNNQCTIHLYDGNTVPSSGNPTPTATPSATPTPTSNGILNGGFETGDFTGWTTSGTTSISTNAHSGSFAAEAGTNAPTNGDSSLSQTFTAPSGTTTLS